MLVGSLDISRPGPRVRRLENPDWQVYWQGLAYLDGMAAGEASIECFAAEAMRDLAAAAARLKGLYFVLLTDRRTGRRYAFVDQSGLFHAFYSESFVSTSFLELVEASDLGPEDLDAEAVVEFLQFGGAIYFGRTLFMSIRKIEPDQIISITPHGTQVLPKHLRGIEERTCSSLEGFLGAFAHAVRGEHVSLDLTGGVDSRLTPVVLDYFGLPYELAASGMEGNTDLRLAQEVAHALGHELQVTYHSLEDLPGSIPELFVACDGIRDIIMCHRPLQLQKARAQRGMSLMVSGAGGELSRDVWWLQDFPFYSRKRSNVERLFSLRIYPVQPRHTLLAGEYRKLSEIHREKLLRRLEQFVEPRNTETYDNLYYAFRTREMAGQFLTSAAGYLDGYAPYLDREAASFGYALPRWERVYNNFHRRTITRLNPAVARIPTTEGGMRLSTEASYVAVDLAKYVINRAMRLAQKIGHVVLKKVYFRESPNHPGLVPWVRAYMAESRVLEHLQSQGIVANTATIDQVPNGNLGALLTLHLLLERLETNRSSVQSQRVAG